MAPVRRSGTSPRRPEPPPEAPAWVLSGRAWWGGRLQPLEVGVGESGTIVALGRQVDAPDRHDVGERVILPSATDLHVHFRDPGPVSSIEGFASGTRQAALGGVGLVADMPNNEPPVTDRESWETKRSRVLGRSAVDVLLYGALAPGSDVAGLGRRVGAFKLYSSPTTGIPTPPSFEDIPELLRRATATGLPVTVHAEDPDRFVALAEGDGLAAWNHARPPIAEAAAVDRIVRVAPPGIRLHFAHVTQATVAERIRAAGHSFEASPHHLLLSSGDRLGAFGKVNPPLRTPAVRHALWEEFAAGRVPCLASDHAPHPREAKELPFDRAPSGMPNLQTMLPLFLARVRAGELELPRLIAAASERPARWLGQPRGRIALGHRADLLVVDFRERRTIRAREIGAACGWTAFEGREGIFPREHYLGGRAIVREGEFVGAMVGELRRPEYAPEP